MSDPLRNAADVIDVVQSLDDVHVVEVDHYGTPENYGTFELTIEVPQYERVENEPTRGKDTAFCSNVLCDNPVVVPAGHEQGDGWILCEECEKRADAPERPAE